MYKKFDEFLDQQFVKYGSLPMDVQKRKDEWLEALEDLYRQIKSILWPYISDYRIVFNENNSLQVSEEPLGSYRAKAPRIVLCGLGNSYAHLNPIGAFIVGARGRVDMVGPTGKTVKLLLTPKDAANAGYNIQPATSADYRTKFPGLEGETEWVWKIATPPPYLDYLELTEGHFLEALMFVLER